MHRSRITESYGNTMFNFEELPKFSRVVCHFRFPPQQCMRIPLSPHPHKHVLLSVLFIRTIPVGLKWYLLMVLVCIFLMVNDTGIFSCFTGYLYMFFGEMSFNLFWLIDVGAISNPRHQASCRLLLFLPTPLFYHLENRPGLATVGKGPQSKAESPDSSQLRP